MPTNHQTVLREGRFVHQQITETDLGSQEDLLRSLTPKPQGIFIRDFLGLPNGASLHVLGNPNSTLLMTELTKLPFDAYWYPNLAKTGNLSTSFNKPAPNTCSRKINDPWIVPASLGKILFAQEFTASGDGLCYMVVWRERDCWKLPYPNIYDNGQVCMGVEWEAALKENNKAKVKRPKLHQFLSSLGMFLENPCSGHLTSEATCRTFVRALDGWKYPTNWAGRLTLAGNELFRGIDLP